MKGPSGGATDALRIDWGFRATTGRELTPSERTILLDTLQEQHAFYQSDIRGAQKLLAIGESAPHADLDARELAAWGRTSPGGARDPRTPKP